MRRSLIIILLMVSTVVNAQPRVGLALSGGAALGFAHVGVLKALEEEGFKPDMVAGSSMGAIVATLYANGYSSDDMMAIIKNDKFNRVGRLVHLKSGKNRSGVSTHASLMRMLSRYIPYNEFDSLQVPLIICVTNVRSGEPEYISSGNELVKYVAASAAMPGIFEAQTIDNELYFDGGVVDNLPSRALLAAGCEVVIGVDVLPYVEMNKGGALNMGLTAIRLMQHRNSIAGREACRWLIEPNAVASYYEFDFDKYREIYEIGYNAAKEYINQHPEMRDVIPK